ncbi:MAG: ribbon-helix-helix protein, CopG family [Desulfurococcales archaeon]|nr:ribbon-helix-helix protein, CopG family [Desulfurococcales archaeon]
MVVKTGVSLPEDVYDGLVNLAQQLGYPSLSSVIRDAIELFVGFRRWWLVGGIIAGTLQVLLKPSSKGIMDIPLIEEKFRNILLGSMKLPIGDYLLYLFMVNGDGALVKEFYKELLNVNGVIVVQPSLLPVGSKQNVS